MKRRIKALITHPLFSGSAVMIIGSNLVSVLNYFYHLVMGRMLGPANYGELAALISLLGLLGMIPSSLTYVITKYVSEAKTEAELHNLINWFKAKVFSASLIFFVFVLILAPLMSSFLKVNRLSYLVLIAISALFSLQSTLNRAILQGLLKFRELVLSTSIENTTKLLVSVLLVYAGFAVNGALLAFVVTVILGWYITNRFLPNRNRDKSNTFIDVKSMFAFTIPVFIQSISITSIYSSDVILVKHFFSSHDAGIYAALSTIAKIIFFATGPIITVMFPLVSKKRSRGEPFRKVFIYTFGATALLSIFSLVAYWLFPSLVIQILYGSAYLEASRLLVWFGIFISLFTLSSVFITYNLSLGKARVALLPLVAAIIQIIIITLFHQTLFMVILASIVVNALLLLSLLIYSTYRGGLFRFEKGT